MTNKIRYEVEKTILEIQLIMLDIIENEEARQIQRLIPNAKVVAKLLKDLQMKLHSEE